MEVYASEFYLPCQSHAPIHRVGAAVAQLVEHVIRNDGVVGSSPISGTISLQIAIKTSIQRVRK